MATVAIDIKMEHVISVNGYTINDMVQEVLNIQTVANVQELGKMTSN